ncbi:diguanylate cyclase [Nitratireductor sp. CAU 1489]|uniref:diguanylate cyclase n=1 Tax=Nitratireductor arenosus TaxID=2682096 RepID=A0A844QHL8_9HYPH|nr:GGDEF domain-containing protein [Nitratireductor arenosus]MVA97470.1 diguanylate cyclase [Nitratireductor arenosus]
MIDLSPTSRTRVYLLTVLGTLVCMLLAFVMDGFSVEHGRWQLGDRWINNLIIPAVVAPPFFYFLLTKLRELSLAHGELLTVASTDSLTNCLNRRAFSSLVDGYLSRFDEVRESGNGALLVLDVDRFKAVNDQFGHESGDEALRLIAAVIQSSVRDLDLVARIGGEEFGVFLPGLDLHQTIAIAERIRAAVQAAEFAPAGERHDLSLSIGGVSFIPPATFSQLYRNADRRLYAAKHAGRNRVEIGSLGSLAGQDVGLA